MDITAAWSREGDSTGLEQEDRRQHKELHKLCNPLNARCLIRAGLPCHTTAPDTRWVHPCCNVWRLQRTSIPPPPPAWPLLLQTEGFCSQPDGAGGDLAGIAVLQVLHESEGPFPTTVKNTVILRSPTSYKRCNTSYTEVPNMCLTASLATITGIRHCSALSATWTLPAPIPTAALWGASDPALRLLLCSSGSDEDGAVSCSSVLHLTKNLIVHTKPGHHKCCRFFSFCASFISVWPSSPILMSIIK